MTLGNKHKNIKESGQVFTPNFIVCNMLDWIGYNNSSILQKHIIDNSCGDGAFLQEIVKRYCTIAKEEGIDRNTIAEHLTTYIHGIEIDDIAYNKCIDNLNLIIKEHNIPSVNWNILNTDALTVTHYNERMDFVVGNPPYVRVHNLNDQYNKVKEFRFTSKGMTDLYLAFFEIGFNMLSPTGIMTYITPSSWINSTAAIELRNYIFQNKNLNALTDLVHYQAFDNITSYTIISQFSKSRPNDDFEYYYYNPQLRERNFQHRIKYTEAYIDGNIYLSDPDSLKIINSVISTKNKKIIVKNGFATLKDKFFINTEIPESKYTIPVIKASTGKWSKGFFPYDKQGKPIEWNTIKEEENISSYLITQKEIFFTDTEKDDWYLYGRTQALADVHKNKYAISSIIKDKESIKINHVPTGCGIYSGLYILTDIDEATIKNIIISDSFINYIQLLRKYKSGGYYTFNSKDLQQYLNYIITYAKP